MRAIEATHVEPVVAPSLADDFKDLIGKRVGNYVIDRPLARGGMAIVFVAKHPTIGREVAVKFLNPALRGDLDVAERFIQEAKVTATLSHPNVVEILDFGELDKRPYYMMELLQGSDLRQTLRAAPKLPYATVVRYIEQVCDALEAAHKVGVVHRDLKPDNIFVIQQDPLRLKVMDFGVAKAASSPRVGQTLAGQVLGTPTHMSPEQALGDNERVTPSSDIYALGVIAFEMLTGRLPFYAESAMLLISMHIRDPVPSILKIAPEVPVRIAQIVEDCLAKDPAHRPKTARALASQLATACRLLERELEREAESQRASTIGPETVRDRSNQVVEELAHRLAKVEKSPARDEHGIAVAQTKGETKAALQTKSPPSFAAPPSSGGRVMAKASNVEASDALNVALGAPVKRNPAPVGGFAPVLPVERALRTSERVVSPSPPVAEQEIVAAPLSDYPPDLPEEATATRDEFTAFDADILDRLLRRMQRKGDFPSFLSSMAEIVAKADANSAFSAAQLAEALRRDFGLTAKLLRVVNTSFFNRFKGRVYNVNQAVVILGFDSVRSIASSVCVYKVPGMIDNGAKHKSFAGKYTNRLAESAINSLVSGEIARILADVVNVPLDSEMAMMAATFRNLGQHLVMQYLPEEFDKIDAVVVKDKVSVSVASERLLGLSLRKVGQGVMERWQLPKTLSDAVGVQTRRGDRLDRDIDRLSALAQFSNDLCEIVARGSQTTWTRSIQRLLERNANLLSMEEIQVAALVGTISQSFEERFAALLGPYSTRSRFLAGARAVSGQKSEKAEAKEFDVKAQAVLDQQTERLAQSLQKRGDPVQLAEQCLELVASTLNVPRVIFLVPSLDRKFLDTKAAFGPEAAALRVQLRLPLTQSGSVFASTLQGTRPVSVADTFSPKDTKRIPQPYYEKLGSPCFTLMPCSAVGYPTSLLLVDANTLERLPSEERMQATRGLRALLVQLGHRLSG
jgi:serine/threonine protein kinase/HD-like signal output (HDOD) protein